MLIITDASMSMVWNEIKILHVRAISLFWDMLSFIWSRSLGFDGPSIFHKIPYVHNMRDMLNVGKILGNILCFFWLFEATLDLSKYYLIHLNPVTFTIATLLASFSVKQHDTLRQPNQVDSDTARWGSYVVEEDFKLLWQRGTVRSLSKRYLGSPAYSICAICCKAKKRTLSTKGTEDEKLYFYSGCICALTKTVV